MHQLFRHLVPPDDSLFFSKHDSEDPRLGDIVGRDPDSFPGEARCVLVGVPQDIGVRRNSGRPGAMAGPVEVRRMLYKLTPYAIEPDFSIPEGSLFDAGDIDCGGELEEIHDRLENVIADICGAGAIPIVIGGGHDITYAAASGVYRAFGELGAVNLDAHLDVRPPVPERNSGTSFRMLIEEKKLMGERFVEYGIQPHVASRAHVDWLKKQGGRIVSLEQIGRDGFDGTFREALGIATAGGRPTYGTLDIDGVRAADAPGVSATSPDGLTARNFLDAAAMLGADPNCVALDIAEVNPTYDTDGRTAKLAAHAIVRFVVRVLGRA